MQKCIIFHKIKFLVPKVWVDFDAYQILIPNRAILLYNITIFRLQLVFHSISQQRCYAMLLYLAELLYDS